MSVNICDANGNLTRVDGMAFGGWTLLKEGTTGTSYPLDIANLISNYSEVCVAVPIDSDNETYWDSFIIPTALMSPSSLKSFYGSRYFDSSNFEMINLQTYFSNGNNIRVAFFAQGTAVTRSWKLYARNSGGPAPTPSGGGTPIKIIEDKINDTITFNENGYANISTYVPSNITGYTLSMTMIRTWSSGVAYGTVTDGRYLFGPPNGSVTGLVLQYFYLKNDEFDLDVIW